MYNRLFTKILDSSIWLEPLGTRVVWITLLAAMDEDGFASFACPANVARRAGVTDEECSAALACLLGPDANSSDPDNEGRRLERIPGGYLVLNAAKYRALFSREIQREQVKRRVAKHRAGKDVTQCNADVTVGNDSVTQSEAEAEAEAKQKHKTQVASLPAGLDKPEFRDVWGRWVRARKGMGKKPKDWTALFHEQLRWLESFGPAVAAEICATSIRNGWQGLFEPKAKTEAPSARPNSFVLGNELARIESRLKDLDRQRNDNAGLNAAESAERKQLREHRVDIRSKLGLPPL